MTSGGQEQVASESDSKGSRRSSIDSGETGAEHGASGANINHYIASLHLERSNTKAGVASSIVRRKTLIKQAKDPKADQAALEREIQHVERLASLLGRRQTRFKHKVGKVKVNHDLDATLDGFFDEHEDDKVGDMLLNVGLRQTDDAQDGDVPVDPELKQQNIRAASTALIVSHQEAQAEFAEDPFDKIEAMNLKKSPSGSAEYLPIDGYATESNSDETKATAAANSNSGNSDSARVAGGKITAGADRSFGASALLDMDDDLETSINRSNTWKRQSVMLIKEREKYGPALPRIADDDGSESESELSLSDMSASMSDSAEEDRDSDAEDKGGKRQTKAAPSTTAQGVKEQAVAAFASQKTPTSAGMANREMISDYLDILDFMDSNDGPASAVPQQQQQQSVAKRSSEVARPRTSTNTSAKKAGAKDAGGEDDGHVSSDPSGSSDSSEIELSENNDSDSDYFSRLGTQRTFKIANVLSSEESCGNIKQPTAEQGASQRSAPETNGGVQQLNELTVTADSANASQASSVLAGRSTLRRNRRVLGKGRSLRYGPTSAKPGAAALSVSADASARTSIASDAGVDIGIPYAGIQSLKQSSVHRSQTKTTETAASIVSDVTTTSSRSGQTAVAASSAGGLAKLASEAVAAAARLPATRGARATAVAAQPSGAWSSKSLPMAADRVVRTMDVAEEAARSRPTTAQSLEGTLAAAASRGRMHGPVPPLPQKERPRVPRDLAEGGAETRAEAGAALELPSSRVLFDASGRSASLSQSRRMSVQHLHMHGVAAALPLYQHPGPATKAEAAGVTLAEWLRRTDMLLPSNNPVDKPSPFPPGSEGKQTFNTYYYVPADKLPPGSASPSALSQSNSDLGGPAAKPANSSRPTTANGMRARGRVVRTVTLVPPSLPTASSARSFSSASSIHSSASHQPFSLSNSPLHSRANSPFGNHRVSITSTVSIPTSTHSAASEHQDPDLEPSSTTAYAHASAASTSSPKKFFTDPPSMANQPYASAAPAFLQPNVLSAPPGDDEPSPHTADAPPADGFAEPSAPMLLEPTAPELPAQWAPGAPYAAPYAASYAYPMPVPVYCDPAAYGYPGSATSATFSPHTSMGFAVPMTMPLMAQQQQQAYHPHIPEQLYMQLQLQQQQLQHVVSAPGMQSPTIALVPERPLPYTPPAQLRPRASSLQRPRPQSVPDEQQLHLQQQQQTLPPLPPKDPQMAPKQQNSADQASVVSPPPTYEHSQKGTAPATAAASVTSPCPSDFVIVTWALSSLEIPP
ncbi:hypothetical protein H4R99_002875 [Coemansia sp. RSA 1722]|nr:hypothetical protein H4R99_002875 [Coemansia sp. RSA 1722]